MTQRSRSRRILMPFSQELERCIGNRLEGKLKSQLILCTARLSHLKFLGCSLSRAKARILYTSYGYYKIIPTTTSMKFKAPRRVAEEPSNGIERIARQCSKQPAVVFIACLNSCEDAGWIVISPLPQVCDHHASSVLNGLP